MEIKKNRIRINTLLLKPKIENYAKVGQLAMNRVEIEHEQRENYIAQVARACNSTNVSI